ncbi:MAG TPA: hypothetical protein VLY63_14640 [Anaerolineae bacterium]|nr:hypothetical protein [Anaerolineae bacterium]
MPGKWNTYRATVMLRISGVQASLAEELADAATFIYKLAYQCGVDPEDALKANMIKAEKCFSVDCGRADTVRYLARQAENLTRVRE